MRIRMLGRKLATLAVGLASGALLVSGTTASADPVGVAGVPTELGVHFVPDGNGGQCVNSTNTLPSQTRWTTGSDWTPAIGIDTDNRAGGCRLAFGIRDLDNTLAGLGITYQLTKSAGSDDGQCGDNSAVNDLPITRFAVTGATVRQDSDNRGGWCDLTFTMSGRNDYGLDIQYYGSSNQYQDGQCRNALPQGTWYTVRPGLPPITLHIDADGRGGWCNLSFRLRQF